MIYKNNELYEFTEACKKGLIEPAAFYNAMMETGTKKYSSFKTSQFKLLGDVNNDGVVNIDDSTAIQKHISQLSKLNNKFTADTNGDGIITIDDASRVQKSTAEVIASFDVYKTNVTNVK